MTSPAQPYEASCLFCKIIRGEIPAAKVLETEAAIAFLDIQPVILGHVLLVPKEHHADLTELPEGPDRSGALMGNILTRSLTVRGFIQTEFVEKHHDAFLSDMSKWVQEGKIRYREDIADGILGRCIGHAAGRTADAAVIGAKDGEAVAAEVIGDHEEGLVVEE